MKCLDFFSKNLLSEDEMLDMTEDLFGSQHEALFLEFKRLLNNRMDYDGNKRDMWFVRVLSFHFPMGVKGLFR